MSGSCTRPRAARSRLAIRRSTNSTWCVSGSPASESDTCAVAPVAESTACSCGGPGDRSAFGQCQNFARASRMHERAFGLTHPLDRARDLGGIPAPQCPSGRGFLPEEHTMLLEHVIDGSAFVHVAA